MTYREIIRNGLWVNNPGIVQLLGLCPLLAVSNTLINGLGLGLATIFVMVTANAAVSSARRALVSEIRIPVFVLIIASLVTTVELAMSAWFHELYRVLGIFIPLIVTNCAIIGRAEAFASKNTLTRSVVDGLMMGGGFALVLVLLGAFRELLGSGTLLRQADMLFGERAADATVVLIPDYPGFLLALLPPGAFIALGLLVALKNMIDLRLSTGRVPARATAPATEPSR